MSVPEVYKEYVPIYIQSWKLRRYGISFLLLCMYCILQAEKNRTIQGLENTTDPQRVQRGGMRKTAGFLGEYKRKEEL